MTSSVREIMPFKILPFPHLIVQMVKARLLIEKKKKQLPSTLLFFRFCVTSSKLSLEYSHLQTQECWGGHPYLGVDCYFFAPLWEFRYRFWPCARLG